MSKVTCVVCQTPVEYSEVSQYAAYSGLPSPCCEICFEVRDYTDKSIHTVAAKSLLKRAQMMGEASHKND